MRLSEASRAYLSQKRLDGYSPHTIAAYAYQHQVLIRDVGDLDLEAITLQVLRDALALHANLKPASLGHKVRALRAWFGWLAEEEYLARNPTLKLREPKQPDRVPKALTLDELEMLRDACRSALEHALVEVFFATGARVREVWRLNRNAVDFDRRAVLVMGKGGKEREVYFGSRAAIWLRRYLYSRRDADVALFATDRRPWRRISIHQMQYIFRRIARRAGLEGRVTPHVLRHTFATTMLNQDAPLAVVQSLLGHAKPETTLIYARLSGAARQRAYARYFVQ
jgi:integrase/recombinase XerD